MDGFLPLPDPCSATADAAGGGKSLRKLRKNYALPFMQIGKPSHSSSAVFGLLVQTLAWPFVLKADGGVAGTLCSAGGSLQKQQCRVPCAPNLTILRCSDYSIMNQ